MIRSLFFLFIIYYVSLSTLSTLWWVLRGLNCDDLHGAALVSPSPVFVLSATHSSATDRADPLIDHRIDIGPLARHRWTSGSDRRVLSSGVATRRRTVPSQTRRIRSEGTSVTDVNVDVGASVSVIGAGMPADKWIKTVDLAIHHMPTFTYNCVYHADSFLIQRQLAPPRPVPTLKTKQPLGWLKPEFYKRSPTINLMVVFDQECFSFPFFLSLLQFLNKLVHRLTRFVGKRGGVDHRFSSSRGGENSLTKKKSAQRVQRRRRGNAGRSIDYKVRWLVSNQNAQKGGHHVRLNDETKWAASVVLHGRRSLA